MVEGPTAKAYAVKINREFIKEIIKEIFTKSRKVYVPLNELLGKKFSKAETYGKNILLFFEEFAIRLHLMMFGAIHIYKLDAPLLKPERQVRLLIKGERKKLVVYNAPIVEIDRKRKLIERLKNELGPDPLRQDWNREEAIRRIMKYKGEKIGVVLLDQSVIAGVGNILRNEILFKAKVNPERLVADLSKEEIEAIVKEVEELSKKFLELKLQGKRLKPILYVYNRYSKPCKICGRKIRFYMQEPIKRKTFVCENCQK